MENRPTQNDLEYHARVALNREEFVRNHPVVRQNIIENPSQSAIDKLKVVKYQIAKEVAVLEFDRMEMAKRGVDTSQVSTRIVNSLKQIADIELEVKKLGSTVVDPNSAEVQAMFKSWIGTLQKVAEEVMNPEDLDLFFNKFSMAIDGWEKRTK